MVRALKVHHRNHRHKRQSSRPDTTTTHRQLHPHIHPAATFYSLSHQLHKQKPVKMVQLTEVTDEEFMREQEGPVDDEDWDTDSGTIPQSCLVTNPIAHFAPIPSNC